VVKHCAAAEPHMSAYDIDVPCPTCGDSYAFSSPPDSTWQCRRCEDFMKIKEKVPEPILSTLRAYEVNLPAGMPCTHRYVQMTHEMGTDGVVLHWAECTSCEARVQLTEAQEIANPFKRAP
jgi:hypothetical protein